jgi:uncharacterized protein YceH (UPF0502 family)
MNLAEASAFRALAARVADLENQVKDLVRRLDDFSKAERAKKVANKFAEAG